MAEEKSIKFSVTDSSGVDTHVSRASVLSLEDASGLFFKAEDLSKNRVEDMIKAFSKNGGNAKFKIVWEPEDGFRTLMAGLKATKKVLKVYLYFLIRDGSTLKFMDSATFEQGNVSASPRATGRAMQEVEFTAKFKPQTKP